MFIILGLFIVLAVGTFALLSAFDGRGEQARLLRIRLAAIEQASERGPGETTTLLRDELLSSVPALNRWLKGSHRIARLQCFMAQAGLNMRAGKFLVVSAALGAVCGLVLLQLFSSVLLAIVAVPLAGLLPATYVSWLRRRRFHKFELLFPEAIDLLGRSVRAGHAFNSSLELITAELGEPVAGEFRKMYEEQKFGLPMRDVLLNFAERVPIVDVKFFVTAVLLQRETGGNLVEILDKLSYLIRERFKILRQVRVFTAQGRMTMTILMALPFICAVLMSFVAPQMLSLLFTDPLGRVFVLIGFVQLIIGYLIIRKIIRIRV